MKATTGHSAYVTPAVRHRIIQKINSSTWNYHPDVPIPQGRIFHSIKNPFIVAQSIFFSWFDSYGQNDFLAIIFLLWLFVMPAMETIAADSWAWIAHKFTAHPILMLVCAGPFRPLPYHIRKAWTETEIRSKADTLKTAVLTRRSSPQQQVLDTCVQHSDLDSVSDWLFVRIPYIDSTHFYLTHRFLIWYWVYK
tara:strand:- start:30 stop:611 length:582 start_codon:yes stop_codon:yes gene_type:complete